MKIRNCFNKFTLFSKSLQINNRIQFIKPLTIQKQIRFFGSSSSTININENNNNNNNNKIKGKISLEELTKLGKKEEIETVVIAFTDHLGRLMGKRYDIDFFLNNAASAGSHACTYLMCSNLELAVRSGFKLASWEKGYGDFHMQPDLDTLRIASWLPKTAIIFCDIFHNDTHKMIDEAPRTILKKQLEKANSLGFGVSAATELEYFIFGDSYEQANQKGYRDLKRIGWYYEDYHILQGTREEKFNALARKHLKNSGVPVEGTKGEYGLGQHELNIIYSDALEMADRHMVYKQCLKEIAESIGMSVTFMPKFHHNESGSGCHLHLNLTDLNGKNAFKGESELKIGENKANIKCSDEFRWFLGGWIKFMPDTLLFYAPTINSYKRFRNGSWAPTRLAWSQDNRTAGFRIVGSGNSLRVECRIPGADCVPYLGLAAATAAGLEGIQKRIEPPPIFEGDVYSAKHLPQIPMTFGQAITNFEKSEFSRKHFGDDIVDHYVHHSRLELEEFESFVTDWERMRYFEQI
eukprot:TRINITY_DN2808_c0_g3_i1.p1 TRINITY_DN2808_c0_g3~~TRINITY_DN2808_c0_g3_i1.p1  ORF type:complete len:522 (-),score=234.07 TRINITY_DN2808_c0_g3_i1:107-1672(-)